MRTVALIACPSCGAHDSTPVPIGSHELRRCDACGLVRAPEYAHPDEVFVEGYMTGETRFGLDVTHPRFQEFLREVQDARLEALERHVSIGRVLDVGAGRGELLDVARRRGWQAAGVEPLEESATYAREARGLDVRIATLHDAGLPEGGFDAVCMTHVLEHVPDATGFLRLASRYGRPGAAVLIEVPNFACRERWLTGDRWRSFRRLEHLSHFTPTTLRMVIERAGLEPVDVSTRAYLSPLHTLDEVLEDLACPSWRSRLGVISPTREVLGAPAKVPGPLSRPVIRALRARDERRGAAAVVLAIARVP